MLECGPDDLVIALMGMTGAGKSSFISLLVGQAVVVGHQLQSCTQDISVYSFVYDGGASPKRVFLVDSPGFDDDTRTDSEILRSLIAWLTEAAAHKITLSGIIYLHRINQPRLQGSAKKNIRQFEKLCGDGALAKVILVTTMWDIEDPEVAVERERQLRETKEFWGYMTQKGSKMYRHSNTRESALQPIRHFIKDDSKMALDVVTEALKPLTAAETEALVDRRLAEERAAFQAVLADIRAEVQKALKQKDEEVAEVVQQLRQEHQARIELLQKNVDDLRGELASLGSKRTSSTPLSQSSTSIPKRRPVGTPSGQLLNTLHNTGSAPDRTCTPPAGAGVENQPTPTPEAKPGLTSFFGGSATPPDRASPPAQTPAEAPPSAPFPPPALPTGASTTESPVSLSSSPLPTQSTTATTTARPPPQTKLSSSLSLHKLSLSSTPEIPTQPRYTLTSILAHNNPVTSLAFSPDSTRLGAAAATEVHVWAAPTSPSAQPQLQHTIQHTGPVSSLSFSPDSLRLASGVRSPAGGGALLLCAPSNPGGDAESYATEAAVAAVAFAPPAAAANDDDDAVVAPPPRLAVAAASSVLVWNTAARAFEDHLGHAGPVSALAYCPRTGRRLAVVQGAGDVVVWGRSSPAAGWGFERVLTHAGGGGGSASSCCCCCVAFAPDGTRIAAGAVDGSVLLWSVESGLLERSLPHEVGVGAVAFTPDGEKVVVGLMDGSIRVWGAETGVPLQTLRWHEGPVLAVALSGDGLLLASGSVDKRVCFGRLQGGVALM